MTDILRELYNGKIKPIDEKITDNKEYEAALTKLNELEEDIKLNLNPMQQELFNNVRKAQMDVMSYESFEKFVQGWKLGCQFTSAMDK